MTHLSMDNRRVLPDIRPVMSCMLLAATAACASTDPTPAITCTSPDVPTDGWQRVDLDDFSLRMPPDFTAIEVRGIDSRVGAYRAPGDAAEVTFDLGWYSNDLSMDSTTYTEYRACTDVIGGHPATIIVGALRQPSTIGGRHVVAAAWRDIQDSDPPVHLTVWSTARDADLVPVLLAIVRSVNLDEAASN